MKKPTSLTEIVKLEKAIEQRWGSEAVSVPIWDKKREAEYLEQLRTRVREASGADSTTFECDGFLFQKKLFNGENVRSCPICESYLFYAEDDLFVNKYDCCSQCYFKYVEGREEKWAERKRELLNESHKVAAEAADQGRGSQGGEGDGEAG